jgi:hypothetical protein
MPKFFLNFEEVVSRAHGNSEEQNKVLDSSIIIINYLSLMYMFVCLFPCRYNPLWMYFHSPVAGFSLLVFEVS